MAIWMQKVDGTRKEKRIKFRYKNYKGEISERVVEPLDLVFHENNEYHGTGWILEAIDIDKGSYREFLLKDIIKFY